LRAARAKRAFDTDKMRIRIKSTVMVNTKHGLGVLSKIADCAQTAFFPRNSSTLQQPRDDSCRHV
jgi:hypothetical protein